MAQKKLIFLNSFAILSVFGSTLLILGESFDLLVRASLLPSSSFCPTEITSVVIFWGWPSPKLALSKKFGREKQIH